MISERSSGASCLPKEVDRTLMERHPDRGEDHQLKQDAKEKERGLEMKVEPQTENDHEERKDDAEGQHTQGEDGVHQERSEVRV